MYLQQDFLLRTFCVVLHHQVRLGTQTLYFIGVQCAVLVLSAIGETEVRT